MTEKQWFALKSVDGIIDRLVDDRRQLRLLACACARRMLAALPDDPVFEAIIAAAEDYADAPKERDAAVAARKPLRDAVKRLTDSKKPEPLKKAAFILTDLTKDVLEGFTAGVLNARWVMTHKNAVRRAEATAEKLAQIAILRDLWPWDELPFDPNWRTSTAVGLAQTMYDARHFNAMPILADALQDAGCEDAGLLDHCRDANGVHVRGCWVVDLVLGKA